MAESKAESQVSLGPNPQSPDAVNEGRDSTTGVKQALKGIHAQPMRYRMVFWGVKIIILALMVLFVIRLKQIQ